MSNYITNEVIAFLSGAAAMGLLIALGMIIINKSWNLKRK